MPGLLLPITASINCPHAGPARIISSNTRVLANGAPVATVADQAMIAGCAFNVSGAPHPCITIKWLTTATKVLINGQFALLQTSAGLCISGDQTPQGPPVIVPSPVKVSAL